MQTSPLCVPGDDGVTFVWLEKQGQTYSIWSRRLATPEPTRGRRRRASARGHRREDLTDCVRLHSLREGEKPSELQAVHDQTGALWVSWAQAAARASH